jgi:hypothetical protein
MGENGSYICLLKINFIGITGYSSFTVSYSEEILVTNKTVIVAVSSTFAVILLILIIFVGVKNYYDKVNISNLLVSKKSVSEKLKINRPI